MTEPTAVSIVPGGIRLPLATAAFLLVAVLLTIPAAFVEPTRYPHDRVEDYGRILPPTIVWCLTGIVLVVALLLAITVAVGVVRHVLQDSPVRVRRLLGGMSGVALAYIGFDVFLSGTSLVFSDVYSVLGPGDPRSQPVVVGARVMGAFGLGASLFIAVACWTLTVRLQDPSAGELRARWRAWNSLLVLASVGLASGAIATGARLELQLDPAFDEVTLGHARAVLDAALLGYGGFYTLLLLGLFLPTAYVLRSSGYALSRAAKPEGSYEERQAWLREEGLMAGIPSRLLSTLAALAPLLTSTLSSTVAKALADSV